MRKIPLGLMGTCSVGSNAKSDPGGAERTEGLANGWQKAQRRMDN